MKTKFEQQKEQPPVIKKFPCIGILSDRYRRSEGHQLVVLFTEDKTGTVLHQDETCWIFGSYTDTWDMEQFRPILPGEKLTLIG